MVKIVFAAGIASPDIGGPATYVAKLAGQLNQPVISYSRRLKKYPKGLKHLLYLFGLLWLARDAEVIFAQNPTSAGLPAFLASKLLGKKFILKIVGDAAWEQKKDYLKIVQSFVARKADRIIVPSQYVKKMAASWGVPEERIEVIYNAVEPDSLPGVSKGEAKKKIGIEGDVILSVGRPVPWKGFDDLKSIMPDLLKENPNFRLVIVGEDKKVPHEQMPFYFKAADIFVLNSGYEGLSHVILEAMSYGVPVIASSEGGNPELIEDGFNGFLVQYKNREQIKQAVLKLWRDKELQQKFIQNSKEKLKNFTWENLVEKTLRILGDPTSPLILGEVGSQEIVKNVLFIGVTKYDLERDVHLEKKFGGLAQGLKSYVLARGCLTFGRKTFGAEFYLLPRNIFFWPVALILAFWLCLAKKIDVIVAQSPLMEGLAGVILKKILKKELIVEMHGDWQVKKSIGFLVPFSLKNADKIRGVARYLIAKAKTIAPDKPYFIFPTFTDLDQFLSEKEIHFESYVLFVGRNDPVKGIKYLTEAFDRIKSEFPEFRLVLVGEGLVEGKLPLEEVRNKMRSCYCLVVPSVSEGLPRVIMEAMALAKPVIASRVGGIPDVVKDGQTGFLFEAGKVEQLVEKLRALLKNRDMAIEMGRRGRELVQSQFSNEKYLSNHLTMINP